MNDEELVEAISKAKWRFTPYHGHPHEYILISIDPIVWDELALRIDKEGYWGNFYRTKFRYYDFDGWKYWHYEEVLNRAPLPDNAVWKAEKWRDALASRNNG